MFKRGAGVDAEQRNLRFNGMTVGQPCVSGKLGEHFLVVCLLIVSTTSGIFLAAFPPQSFPLVPLISQDCPFWLENQIPLLHPEKKESHFGLLGVILYVQYSCALRQHVPPGYLASKHRLDGWEGQQKWQVQVFSIAEIAKATTCGKPPFWFSFVLVDVLHGVLQCVVSSSASLLGSTKPSL